MKPVGFKSHILMFLSLKIGKISPDLSIPMYVYIFIFFNIDIEIYLYISIPIY